MAKSSKQKLSEDAFIAIISAVIGASSVVMTELNWLVRLLVVAFSVGLMIYAARRHPSNLWIRWPIALIASAVIIVYSWNPIWKDFSNKYPTPIISWHYPDSESVPPAPRTLPVWVTPEETARVDRMKRSLIPHSPDDLATMRDKNQSTDAYYDLWLKIFNNIKNIDPNEDGNSNYWKVTVALDKGEARLYLEKSRWSKDLYMLKPGDKLTALCQFRRFVRQERGPWVLLGYECQPF